MRDSNDKARRSCSCPEDSRAASDEVGSLVLLALLLALALSRLGADLLVVLLEGGQV
eukprot:CAMPEP_0181197050 /NCGR_PEP_ID=MMETSP1096-20121128/15818_1 /TAXON_ID=156174 ORGANISM="Chrysochromulina ericina, Strain CCMP281" /NCGR_SAMPLE_ID=MMETSP1096 /ASSEMBLY_ACC=CAM_ASM_000453 /LENGTH=56 /DNA_ID=CAMNT_0023286903 /DNA_START=211 /DNA_END=377 /DNA_ORIENTATION=+